jgi:hypothetical protein
MVGVFGAPDAHTDGKRLVAFVVPRNTEMVDAAEISTRCASRLVNGWSRSCRSRAIRSWTASRCVELPAAS